VGKVGYIKTSNDLGACERAIQLDDELFFAALGLYVLCNGYCDRQRTDGKIPRLAMLRVIAQGRPVDDLIAELVRVDMLKETPEGWEIPDYLEWQRSAAEIEARSQGARAAANKRHSDAKRNAERNAERNADGNADNHKREQEIDRQPNVLSFSGNEIPDSVLGYWEGKANREATPDDLKSLRSLCKHFDPDVVNTAIGQACAQGESPDNFGLITAIAKKEVQQ
jgi:hypothetical protein